MGEYLSGFHQNLPKIYQKLTNKSLLERSLGTLGGVLAARTKKHDLHANSWTHLGPSWTRLRSLLGAVLALGSPS